MERATQAKADVTTTRCPVCCRPLTRKQRDHQRTVATRFGAVKIRRTRGWRARCKRGAFPPTRRQGLGETGTASPSLREAGQAPSRWHWVYGGATCFRLDQRGETAGGRPVISERGYVMTCGGVEALRELLWAEAVRRGLSQAEQVLVVADGAVWIWNLVADRFARCAPTVGLLPRQPTPVDGGRGTAQARVWVEPLLKQLRAGQAPKVIRRLEELRVPTDVPAAETTAGERQYSQTHRGRLDYAKAAAQGWPLGSGAMEFSCRQYQCRFRRPGQFWRETGGEALHALHDFWRNGRWQQVFPHVSCADLSLN